MSYDSDNVFAKILRGDLPSERVFDDDHTLAFMDIMPRAEGHCLVIPRTAARNFLDASPTQIAACMATAQRIAKAAMVAFEADGITVQQFNEAAGGQEVFHLHYHVLPRFAGVPLRPPGKMEDMAVIKANAEKLRTALGAATAP